MRPGDAVNIEIDMLARYVAGSRSFRPMINTRRKTQRRVKAHVLIVERASMTSFPTSWRGRHSGSRSGGSKLRKPGGAGCLEVPGVIAKAHAPGDTTAMSLSARGARNVAL
jgi:hypothetical protein